MGCALLFTYLVRAPICDANCPGNPAASRLEAGRTRRGTLRGCEESAALLAVYSPASLRRYNRNADASTPTATQHRDARRGHTRSPHHTAPTIDLAKVFDFGLKVVPIDTV